MAKRATYRNYINWNSLFAKYQRTLFQIFIHESLFEINFVQVTVIQSRYNTVFYFTVYYSQYCNKSRSENACLVRMNNLCKIVRLVYFFNYNAFACDRRRTTRKFVTKSEYGDRSRISRCLRGTRISAIAANCVISIHRARSNWSHAGRSSNKYTPRCGNIAFDICWPGAISFALIKRKEVRERRWRWRILRVTSVSENENVKIALRNLT